MGLHETLKVFSFILTLREQKISDIETLKYSGSETITRFPLSVEGPFLKKLDLLPGTPDFETSSRFISLLI